MKLKIFAMMLAMAASVCVFTSCSSDDDDSSSTEVLKGLGTSELEKAPNYDNSAKYEANNPYGKFQSLEFTEDGKYILVLNSIYSGASKQRRMIWEKLCTTRANGYTQQICGDFVKVAENEYILEDFGSVVIEGDADNAYSVIITRDQEEPVVVECSKSDRIKDTQATQWLCRTWDVNAVRLKLSVNNKVIFNESAPGTQVKSLYANCMKGYYNWIKANFQYDDEDDEEDDDEEDDEDMEDIDMEELGIVNLKDITFTRAGTYLFTTPDTDKLAISMWTWEKEEDGLLRYTHNFTDFYDPDLSNNVNATFKGKEMTLYETKTVDESEEEDEFEFEFLIKIETTYSCSHK